MIEPKKNIPRMLRIASQKITEQNRTETMCTNVNRTGSVC